MKRRKIPNQFILIASMAVGILSCTEENIVSSEINQIESEFSKATETKASPYEILAFVQEMDRAIQEQLNHRNGIARTEAISDYDIGLPASATSSCLFSGVTITMDCENSGAATNVSVIQGSSGGSFPWTVTSAKDITMRFCRFDSRLYLESLSTPSSTGLRYGGRHAVLKLGALGAVETGVKQLTRYFDNQDNGTNSIVGDIFPNVVNSNTTLLFQVIPAKADPASGIYFTGYYPYVIATASEFPNNPIPYVKPTPLATFRYYIDDEDNNNKNNWRINNGSATSSSGETFMSGGSNTDIRILKITSGTVYN